MTAIKQLEPSVFVEKTAWRLFTQKGNSVNLFKLGIAGLDRIHNVLRKRLGMGGVKRDIVLIAMVQTFSEIEKIRLVHDRMWQHDNRIGSAGTNGSDRFCQPSQNDLAIVQRSGGSAGGGQNWLMIIVQLLKVSPIRTGYNDEIGRLALDILNCVQVVLKTSRSKMLSHSLWFGPDRAKDRGAGVLDVQGERHILRIQKLPSELEKASA